MMFRAGAVKVAQADRAALRNSSAASARVTGRPSRSASLSSNSTALSRGRKGPLDPAGEIAHHGLVDVELPVGAELDDQRTKQRDRRAATASPPARRAAASADRAIRPRTPMAASRAVISTNASSSRARFSRWNSARSSISAGREVLDHQRAGRERARHRGRGQRMRGCRSRAGIARPRSRRGGSCRSLPGRPAARRGCGHSGQRSISASAAALAGPSRKSSRERLSACGSANASWRG